MSNDLEAILSGEDEAVEEAVEQPRDESGRFASSAEEEPAEEPQEAVEATGEEPAEEPAADVSPASEESKVEDDKVAAMAAELARIRAKNRELEERMTQKAAEPEKRPDFFEDPDAALQTMEQRMEQKIAKARIDWSEQAARQRYQDFDDKIGVFTEMANENPVLWQQMATSPDPADFAYRQANQVQKMREFGSIDKFEEKVRADERMKAEKAALAKYEAKLKELSSLPGSLSDTRAAGGNSSPPVTDEALEDILGR